MRLRLIRKLADRLDGIDLSRCHSGELIEVPGGDADLIVAERWASYARRDSDVTSEAWDRRHSSGNHDRLESALCEIAHDRRHLHRRATDVAA